MRLEERLGVGIAALSAIQRRSVIEARGDVGVIGSPGCGRKVGSIIEIGSAVLVEGNDRIASR
jgi:hypothetical protein